MTITLTYLLLVVSVVTGTRTVMVNVHYPESKMSTGIHFILGYGSMDQPTGSPYAGSDGLAMNRIMTRTSDNTWTLILSDLMGSDGDLLPLSVYAIDLDLVTQFDLSGIYPVAPGGLDRSRDCLLHHDGGVLMFISFANHNITLHSHPDDSPQVVDLYPYFCGSAVNEISIIQNLGNKDFFWRNLPVMIPNSLQENTIPRQVDLLYVLDGSHSVLQMMPWDQPIYLSGREIVVVGVPPTQRLYEYIPFTDLQPPMTLDFICHPCVNTTLGGGRHLASFIRNEVESAVRSILGKRVTGIKSRIIHGFSMGGLMVTWIATHQNSMFDYYIAGSPSVWFNADQTFSVWHDSQPLTNQRLVMYNCEPGDRKAEHGSPFTMTGIAQAFIAFGTHMGLFVPEINLKYFQVGPSLHSFHCAILGLRPSVEWLLTQ